MPSQDVLRMAKETGAIPYDIPGVEMSHDGDLCGFDVFLKKIPPHRCCITAARRHRACGCGACEGDGSEGCGKEGLG